MNKGMTWEWLSDNQFLHVKTQLMKGVITRQSFIDNSSCVYLRFLTLYLLDKEEAGELLKQFSSVKDGCADLAAKLWDSAIAKKSLVDKIVEAARK